MKIAIIGSRGVRSSYGGIEKVLAQLCPRLVRLGHTVDVYSEDTVEARAPRDDGVGNLPAASLPGKYTETLSRSLVATAMALSRGYDVINYVAIGPGMLNLLPRTFGIPTVVSIHGLDWRRDKWPAPARFALRCAERAIVLGATEITVVSRELQTYFQDTYGRTVIHTPNGVDIRDIDGDAALLREFGLEPDGYVLFASRLVPEKGAHELIEAFGKVATDKKLVIAGGGRYDQPYMERLRNLAQGDRYVFTGHLVGERLKAIFAGAHLYVLPSHIEGLSLSLLEAMGFGKAPLVSDVDGLALALTRLLAHPDMVCEMGERARSRVHQVYSWDSVAATYGELYSSLVSRKRLGARRKGATATIPRPGTD
jgi:glycosyltransferase involved in cell wall biosynthesis